MYFSVPWLHGDVCHCGVTPRVPGVFGQRVSLGPGKQLLTWTSGLSLGDLAPFSRLCNEWHCIPSHGAWQASIPSVPSRKSLSFSSSLKAFQQLSILQRWLPWGKSLTTNEKCLGLCVVSAVYPSNIQRQGFTKPLSLLQQRDWGETGGKQCGLMF